MSSRVIKTEDVHRTAGNVGGDVSIAHHASAKHEA